jgi:hypothetical protein
LGTPLQRRSPRSMWSLNVFEIEGISMVLPDRNEL